MFISLFASLVFFTATLSATTIQPSLPSGYVASDSQQTYTTIVGNGGTLIPTSRNDDAVVSIQTTIPITFYGTAYATGSTLSLSTNGHMHFGAGVVSSQSINSALSASSTVSLPGIFPYWDDLITISNASILNPGIYVGTFGQPGSQTMVLEWLGRRFGDTAAASMNFQIIFTENSEVIRTAYNLTGREISPNGASATIGVRRTTSDYTQWSLNTESVFPGMVIDYTPAALVPSADVPEPSAAALLLLGLGAMVAARRVRS